jgi:hypothetical protein
VAGNCPQGHMRGARGEETLRRAESRVQKTLQRALARAARLLGGQWRRLAEDLG